MRSGGLTLVELLVVVVIGSIVTGALVLTWFSLSDSYSFTTRSTEAADFARDSIARMSRELRDAEPVGSGVAIISASNDEISFTTTFNEAGNESRLVEPVLTRYYFEWDEARGIGRLHRQRGTRDLVIVDNLLNARDASGTADIFRYAYVSSDSTYVPDAQNPEAEMLGTISMIKIRLIVDLNPESAPQPMEVTVTAHLRNQRSD